MEKNIYHQIKLYLGILLVTTVSGCIKDDLSDCPTGAYRLVVQTDPRDYVKPGEIEEVGLFLFDENNRFIGFRSVTLDNIMELNYPSHNKLKAVAWANTGGGHQNISAADENLLLDNANVQLYDLASRAQSGFSGSPDDLFHGIKDLDLNKDTRYQPDVLTIIRKVAAITITARHLEEYAGTANEPYTYEVRSSKNTIDFYGNLQGEDTKYLPSCSFNQNREFVAPAFYVFPSEPGENIAIDIYKGNLLVYTISTDEFGQPIRTEEGKLLEVVVDFSAGVNIGISIEEWDKVQVSGEF